MKRMPHVFQLGLNPVDELGFDEIDELSWMLFSENSKTHNESWKLTFKKMPN